MDIGMTDRRHEPDLRRCEGVVVRYFDVEFPQPACSQHSPISAIVGDCFASPVVGGLLGQNIVSGGRTRPYLRNHSL